MPRLTATSALLRPATPLGLIHFRPIRARRLRRVVRVRPEPRFEIGDSLALGGDGGQQLLHSSLGRDELAAQAVTLLRELGNLLPQASLLSLERRNTLSKAVVLRLQRFCAGLRKSQFGHGELEYAHLAWAANRLGQRRRRPCGLNGYRDRTAYSFTPGR
jgi:hypothetical protein